MFQKEILLKIGEIYLKGKNRSIFESALFKSIKKVLNQDNQTNGFLNNNFCVKRVGSVFFVSGDNLEDLIPKIKKIFGISSFSLSLKVEKNIKNICEAALYVVSESKAKSFKIETKRIDKNFSLKSPEICNQVGEFVLEKTNISVDVHNPDIVVFTEIHNDYAYVVLRSYKGAGGLPKGTSGKGLVLMSGGIDSPVASFMMAKRGLSLTAVHFSTPPYTSLKSIEKVQRILEKLSHFCGSVRLYTVSLTQLQKNIKMNCPEELFTIISRRIMGKIASEIASKGGCSCLITGESLGQVASQTLPAMVCTSDEIGIPIFRPLIGMDKSEIIEIAKNIGTFEISIEPFDDCCSIFSPKYPKVNPKLKFVKIAESKIKNIEELIKDTLDNSEIKIIEP
ncbi:MAG: tRNA 4-thiouridine(8) synthase ThiI [Oscillospiraceae bacterium]|nr:tRNA 4-thiouridine(8) synthase ThiI [Oscillospiraceae bacterium]